MRPACLLALLLILGAGCGSGGGGSSSGGSPFVSSVHPQPSPAPPPSPSPRPSSTTSPQPSPSSSSGGGGTSSGSSIAITTIDQPEAVHPGEQTRIGWVTVSTLPIVSTEVLWGTTRGSHPNEGRMLSGGAGAVPFADSITAPRSEGQLFFVIRAADSSGAVAMSGELGIDVHWPIPTGALLIFEAPNATIPAGLLAGISIPIQETVVGVVGSVQVRVDITHPQSGELAISLVSAAGTVIRLAVPSAATTPDVFGTFGDNLTSVDDLGALVGQSASGSWSFVVADTAVPGHAGTVNAVTLILQFETSLPPSSEARPNLVTAPPSNMFVVHVGAAKVFEFNNTVQNLGDGPLDFHGVPNPDGTIDAFQRIYVAENDALGNFVRFDINREKLVGKMFFDTRETHLHYHFANFATYSILDLAFKTVVQSDKISFCIDDFEPIDPALPRFSATNVYYCGFNMQGISVGWADVYVAGIEGQTIDITGVADGTYYVFSQATHVFDETTLDYTDNDAATKFQLRGDTVTVLETFDGKAFAALRAGP